VASFRGAMQNPSVQTVKMFNASILFTLSAKEGIFMLLIGGARLCSAEELKRDETRGTGCGYDKVRVLCSAFSSVHLALS